MTSRRHKKLHENYVSTVRRVEAGKGVIKGSFHGTTARNAMTKIYKRQMVKSHFQEISKQLPNHSKLPVALFQPPHKPTRIQTDMTISMWKRFSLQSLSRV